MFNILPKLLLVALLGFTICTTSACDSIAQKISVCGGVVLADVVSAIIFSESLDAPTVAQATATFGVCVSAYNEVFSSPSSPQNPATVITINQGNKLEVLNGLSTTIPISNCSGAESLNPATVSIEESLKVILGVGSRQFSTTPDSSDTDPLAKVAQDLITHYNLNVGTTLTTNISLTATLPPHSQVMATTPPISVTEIVGNAVIQTGTSKPSDSELWSYPTNIQVNGQPTINGLPTACM